MSKRGPGLTEYMTWVASELLRLARCRDQDDPGELVPERVRLEAMTANRLNRVARDLRVEHQAKLGESRQRRHLATMDSLDELRAPRRPSCCACTSAARRRRYSRGIC